MTQSGRSSQEQTLYKHWNSLPGLCILCSSVANFNIHKKNEVYRERVATTSVQESHVRHDTWPMSARGGSVKVEYGISSQQPMG